MIFWNSFKNSIKLPSKNAMFQLNRVGLDITIFYIIILIFISSIPSIIEWLASAGQFGDEMNKAFALIYFFIVYYPSITLTVFLLIFIIALLAKFLSILVNRKLLYSLLWKMSAFTLTIPFLLYTMFALFFDIEDLYFLLAFMYSIILLSIMVMHYPNNKLAP